LLLNQDVEVGVWLGKLGADLVELAQQLDNGLHRLFYHLLDCLFRVSCGSCSSIPTV